MVEPHFVVNVLRVMCHHKPDLPNGPMATSHRKINIKSNKYSDHIMDINLCYCLGVGFWPVTGCWAMIRIIRIIIFKTLGNAYIKLKLI